MVSNWNDIGTFGTDGSGPLNFYFRVMDIDIHPATFKTKVGKNLLSKTVIMPPTEDTDVTAELYLFGDRRGNINNLTLDQEEDRLIALRDYNPHMLHLGKYSGSYVMTNYKEDIDFNNNHSYVRKFDVKFVQKQL